jgi:hypothetical protein
MGETFLCEIFAWLLAVSFWLEVAFHVTGVNVPKKNFSLAFGMNPYPGIDWVEFAERHPRI